MTDRFICTSCGIGTELARQSVASAHTVIGTLRSGEAPEGVRTVRLDAAEADSIARAAVEIDRPIDCLIHNAGINPSERQDFGSTDPETWARMFDVNVLGPLRMAEAVRPQLR